MSCEPEIVTTPDKPVAPADGAVVPAGHESPFGAVTELIKLAGSAYAIGFVVIMTHTARLHAPVVEALEFQNFVAGLPVWLPLGLGIWLWPRLIRRLHTHYNGLELSSVGFLLLFVGVVFGTGAAYAGIRFIAGRSFSPSENIVLISAVVFASILSILVQILRSQRLRSSPSATLLITISVYSGIITLILAYAILGYPRLPQSIGGGAPVRVKLYFKESGMREALGESPAPPNQNPPSDPVLLYYRTSSYLLILSSERGTLLQIPTDQIRAVDWLESRSK
jgi:hypothetical protein